MTASTDRQLPFEALTLGELQSRTSVKWKLYPPEVLPMWVAEMDALPAPAVAAAIESALRLGDTGYAVGRHYQQAFGRFAQRHWGWTPDMDHAMVVADVMTGIRESVLATTEPGSAVLIPTPVYPPFLSFVTELGREVVQVPLITGPGGMLRLDVASLGAAMSEMAGQRTALLLCSPHNPTGTVHTAAELTAIAELAQASQTTVIVDEIHAPLTLAPAEFVPYLSLPAAQSGIVVTSASKAYNLAALKAALVIPGPEASDTPRRFGEHVKYGASHFGVLSHVAALDHADAWLADVLANIAANRRLLASEIQQRGLPLAVLPGESTYLCWVDCRASNLGDDPAAAFLERGRLAVNSGTHFGNAGLGHVRVNVATRADLISEGVARMASALAGS